MVAIARGEDRAEKMPGACVEGGMDNRTHGCN